MKKKHKLPLSRLLKIRRVVREHGLIELFDGLSLSPKARFIIKVLFGKSKADAPRGERIRKALEDLGPVFIKFGQALSTRPDILPSDIAAELTKLQDQVPPFSGELATHIIKTNIIANGANFDAIFESFETEPMASASVAQVHAAKLKNGKDVVIKVIRPDILPVIESDIDVLYKLAQLANDHWAQGPRLRPLEIIEEYEKTIHGELDMRTEAANAAQMRANFEGSDLIYVPEIYWDYTSQNVMVMERIYGTSIRDIDALKAKGIDLKKLSYDGVEIFFKQAFEDNFFHADMHPGNIFVADDGQYRAVDFGIMGTLTDEDANYLAENFIAFFNRDYRGVADAHLRAGWVPDHIRIEEFETAIRTVCEPIFAKKISEISFGKFLLQLFQTARKFEMPIQPQLVLLQKTLLNIEGLGRQLYEDLDLWDTAKPFLERWMNNKVGPQAFVKKMRAELPMWQKTLPELPRLLQENAQARQELALLASQQSQQIADLERRLVAQSKRQAVRQIAWLSIFSGAGLGLANQFSLLTFDYWQLISTGLVLMGSIIMLNCIITAYRGDD